MSTEEMTRYDRTIWNSPARIRNVSTRQHRMTMRLNNIYSVGEYFFLDFSIENRTNIRFDIDELRIKDSGLGTRNGPKFQAWIQKCHSSEEDDLPQ